MKEMNSTTSVKIANTSYQQFPSQIPAKGQIVKWNGKAGVGGSVQVIPNPEIGDEVFRVEYFRRLRLSQADKRDGIEAKFSLRLKKEVVE